MEQKTKKILDKWALRKIKFLPPLESLNDSDFTFLYIMNNYMEEENVKFVNVSKLSELNQVSLPAISKQLNKLESEKLIKRTIDIFNRRNTKVSITEYGLKVLKESEEKVVDFYDRIVNKCGEEQVCIFSNVLEIIYQEAKGGTKEC